MKSDDRPNLCECGCGARVANRFVRGHSWIARTYKRRVVGVDECSIEGCQRLVSTRGWCHSHYLRWRRWGDPQGGRGETVEARFWEKVQRRGADECWLWLAATNQDGYGLFRSPWQSHMMGAHRAAWILANGEIPEDMQVLHRCDNPPCVNVAHLFLGTQVDNILDMCAKGRHVKAYQKQRQ